jgi:hypothetical protein
LGGYWQPKRGQRELFLDSQGNLSLITSYNAASGGSIVNQVQDIYNGLGQLTGEYQAHSGALVQGSTPEVQYTYTEMAGGQNNSRLTSMTYPSGYTLTYNYNTGLDSRWAATAAARSGSLPRPKAVSCCAVGWIKASGMANPSSTVGRERLLGQTHSRLVLSLLLDKEVRKQGKHFRKIHTQPISPFASCRNLGAGCGHPEGAAVVRFNSL